MVSAVGGAHYNNHIPSIEFIVIVSCWHGNEVLLGISLYPARHVFSLTP